MRTPQISLHTTRRNRLLPSEAYSAEGSAALITVRADRGQPFEGNGDLCSKVIALLTEMRLQYGCWVGAYCLMPDHLHFVAGPDRPDASPLVFVERFKGRSTNESWRLGWLGRLWQRRQHDHVLRSAESQEDIYEYILNNPMRAGLVQEPSDWPWSGVIDHR